MAGIIIGKPLCVDGFRMGFRGREERDESSDRPGAWIRYDGEAPMLTIAPTGAGKGVSTLIPAALTHDGPIVVVDPKGEICAVTAAERARRGDRIAILAPFGLAGGMVPPHLRQHIASFNPIDVIRDAGDQAVDEAITMSSAIVPEASKTEPFWDHAARNLVSATLLWLATSAPAASAHLGALRRCLSSGDKVLAEMTAAMACCNHHDGVIREAAAMLSATPDKTRGSIVSTANNSLAFLRSASGLKSLTTSSISAQDIISGRPMSIYLVLPSDRISSHSTYLRLWLSAFTNLIARRTSAPSKPTLFIIDEWPAIGPLPALRTISFLLRSYGVRSIFCLQTAAQLRMMYPDWESFIHNAGVLQIFGNQNFSAAQTVADLTGVSPLGLTRSQQVLAVEGRPAFVSERISYLLEPRLSSMADPNPYYATGTGISVESERESTQEMA